MDEREFREWWDLNYEQLQDLDRFNACMLAWEACSASQVWAEHVAELEAERDRLRAALIRLRDCDWVITLPDRMDAVRDLARDALEGE